MTPAGWRWWSNVDHVIRELRVELARDSKIISHDPVEFHLNAVGRQLLLAGNPRAGKVFSTSLQGLREERDDGFSRLDYGSLLRDGAGSLALLAEADLKSGELLARQTPRSRRT